MPWPGLLDTLEQKKSEPGVKTPAGTPIADTVGLVTDILGAFEKRLPPSLGVGLNLIGNVASFYSQAKESSAQTNIGRVVDGAFGAAIDIGLGKNPAFVAIDSTVDFVVEKAFGIENFSVSGTASAGAHALVALVEGIITWDTPAMENLHQRSLNGDFGRPAQALSEAGEYLRKNYELHPVVIDALKPIDFDAMMEAARAERALYNRSIEHPNQMFL